MQQVNDDMDELFRRAAEGYPLNTHGADWNAVVKKLSSEKNGEEKNSSSKNKNYKHLLWLLLLLPLGLLYNNYRSGKNNKPVEVASNNNLHKNQNQNVTPTNLPVKNINTVPVTIKTTNPQQAIINTSTNNSTAVKNTVIKSKAKGKINLSITQSNSSSVADKQISFSNNETKMPAETKTELTRKENSGNDDKPQTKDLSENKNETNTTVLQNNDKKEDEISAVKNDVQLKKSQKKIHEHGLYAGIAIGPDISTVKFQSVKNIGVSMGLVIGYQFNKKITVESGILWDRKNYYSKGEFFNTKNISLPTYAEIKALDGSCKMIEVPVSVKYNFRSSSKTNLSVSAGVSSYIMKNEDYDYVIDRYGVQYPRNAAYSNSSTNLLAVAHLGFGIDHNLGKGATFRAEPYVKIPFKGVGIGSLPITSTGINFSITKKLF